MPGGDKTGPNGQGATSGRGAGYCTGNDVPGYMNPEQGRGAGIGRGQCGSGRGMGRGQGGSGRGMGRGQGGAGRGMGRGGGRGFWSRFGARMGFASQRDDVQTLEAQAGDLKAQLEQITSQIDRLKSGQGR